MKVVVFTSTGCGYCKMLKDYLDKNEVSYEEKVIDASEEALEEMQEESGGFMGTPFSVIEKDGEKVKIKGFNKDKFKEVLEV